MAEVKVYSRKLTPAQNAACQKAESVSGLPPVGLDDLDAGRITPREFWSLNVMIIHDIYVTVQNISFPTEDDR